MIVGTSTVNVKEDIMRRKTKVRPIDRNWGIAILLLDLIMAIASIGLIL